MHDMHAAAAAAGQPVGAYSHSGITRRLKASGASRIRTAELESPAPSAMASDHMAAAVRASETTHEYFDGELPSVDDLEVAAAAAMADVAPEPLPATTSDDFMDDGDSDSDAAFSGPGRSALDEVSYRVLV